MRKSYLFISFFVASTLPLLSQINNPTQDTDSYFGEKNCWSYAAKIYSQEYQVPTASHWIFTTLFLHLQGDTLINEKYYRKLDEPYYHSFWTTAIRQENQKIYAFDDELQREYLLYDFGVKEGDVIYSDAPSGLISREPVVEKVDSVWLYNGEQRKRIMVEGDIWIEGIGSIHGFDYPVREFVTCDCNSSYELIAFAKDDVISFFDPEAGSKYGYCGNVEDVFPRGDAIWNIQINGKENYYGLSGDTIIGNKPYNKLYLLNDTTLNIGQEDVYVGGFRQESKKVWYRPNLPNDYINYDYPQYPEETLLYDFSKNVGDTIWHNIIPNLETYYWTIGDSISASIITSIDTDKQGRKIYSTQQYVIHPYWKDFIHTGRYDSWIEGIGSADHGLFCFLSLITLSGYPGFHLACFKQGNEVRYMDNANCNSCFCWSSTGISEKSAVPLEVINKNNSIWVKGKNSVFPCELKLFSPMGQLVLEKQLKTDEEEILINDLKGIYLYQIQKNREIVKTGKIIIK